MRRQGRGAGLLGQARMASQKNFRGACRIVVPPFEA